MIVIPECPICGEEIKEISDAYTPTNGVECKAGHQFLSKVVLTEYKGDFIEVGSE